MEYCENNEKIIEDEQDSEGGWVDTHHFDNQGTSSLDEKVIYSLHIHLHFICMNYTILFSFRFAK